MGMCTIRDADAQSDVIASKEKRLHNLIQYLESTYEAEIESQVWAGTEHKEDYSIIVNPGPKLKQTNENDLDDLCINSEEQEQEQPVEAMLSPGRGLLSFLNAENNEEEQKLMDELARIRSARNALYDLD